MSDELTPLQIKIKSMLEEFTRKEPYITNTAIRISSIMPQDLQSSSGIDAEEYKRGYANGYQVGRNRAAKEVEK